MRKCTVLLLVVCLVVSSFSVLAVPFVSAQAGYKPSVPQISSIKLVDSSYDVPPSTTTNPYTGESTTTPGYHVNQVSIEVSIKNQPFTPYTDEYGRKVTIRYQIQVKAHFEADTGWSTVLGSHAGEYVSFEQQSGSGYTVVAYASTYDVGSQLDFRAAAILTHQGVYTDGNWVNGEWSKSDWSNVKTFTVPNSPSQTATLPPVTSEGNSQPQTPGQSQSPEYVIFAHPFFLLVVGVFLGGAVAAVIMLFLRRHLKNSTYTNNSLYQTSGVKSLYA